MLQHPLRKPRAVRLAYRRSGRMAFITNLDLVAGTPGHVTVVDHNAADAPLPDANIYWVYDTAGLAGNLVITADPMGGFSFLASSPTAGGELAHAVYSAPGVSINGPGLTINVTAEVAPRYTSP